MGLRFDVNYLRACTAKDGVEYAGARRTHHKISGGEHYRLLSGGVLLRLKYFKAKLLQFINKFRFIQHNPPVPSSRVSERSRYI